LSAWVTLDDARKALDAAQVEIDRLRVALHIAEQDRDKLMRGINDAIKARLATWTTAVAE
jgi:ribosomal 50S subunit-associated protein YjgA (DUF615 family)